MKIVTAPGSTFDPIPIPSNAPTPVKKTTRRRIKSSAAAKNALTSTKRKAEDTVAGPSSASTRVKKGKKKARIEPHSEDGEVAGDEAVVVPAYVGQIIDVSEFDTDA